MNAVDTNIFVYAVDSSETVKGPKAAAFLDSLASDGTVVPWQVLCEFGATLAKLHPKGTPDSELSAATELVRSRFRLVMPRPGVFDAALALNREQQVSYWDALLLAACQDAGVDTLFSEDLPGQPALLGVRIVNPLGST